MEPNIMNHRSRNLAVVLLLASAVALSGCEEKTSPDVLAQPTPTSASATPAPAQTPKAPEDGKNDLSISSDQGNENVQPEPEATPKPTATPTVSDIEEPKLSHYTTAEPRLLGVSLEDDKPTVLRLLGEPADKFVMEDEASPITVYGYDGSMIGFDDKDRVVFVSVNEGSVDPGLNGVRVGSTSDECHRLLGEPDQGSEFVLSYRSAGAVLKLDVDPNSEVIHSIKLFEE